MNINVEPLVRSVLGQAIWIVVGVALVIGIVGYATQGVGSAIAKIFGAIFIIMLFVALLRGREIGEWLVKMVFGTGIYFPNNQLLGAITNGIQLYQRI